MKIEKHPRKFRKFLKFRKLSRKLRMKRAVCWFNTLARDERGQSTTEYILMLAVVVMIAMKFKSVFVGQMETVTKGVMGKIQEAVEAP